MRPARNTQPIQPIRHRPADYRRLVLLLASCGIVGMPVGTANAWSVGYSEVTAGAGTDQPDVSLPDVSLPNNARQQSGLAPEVLAVLETLGSPVFEVRDHAEQTLLQMIGSEARAMGLDGEAGLTELESWILENGESLGPEGRARSERIATAMYRRLPLAGMGMAPEQLPNGSIRIATVVPGFHVSEVLREGDVVRSLAGRRLRSDFQMRSLILSFRPGEPVDVEFIRDGQTLRGTIRLGRFDQLANAMAVSEHMMRGAWRERFDRELRSEDRLNQQAPAAPTSDTPTLGDEHPPSAWLEAMDADRDRTPVNAMGRLRPPLNARQAVPRDPFAVQTHQGIEIDTPPRRYFRPDARVWNQDSGLEPDGFVPVIETELAQLSVIEATLAERLGQIEAALAERMAVEAAAEIEGRPEPAAGADDPNAQTLRDMYREFSAQLSRVRAHQQRLRSQLADPQTATPPPLPAGQP